MRDGGYTLGGEQSGHVIMLDHATTGDGTLTALHLLARVAETGTPAARPRRRDDPAAAGARQRRAASTAARVDDCEPLQKAVAEASAELGETGRVLLRPSGTEPVVRVMVEAAEASQAEAVAARLADVVRTELALG